MIFYDQKKRPQEIGEEAAPENDDQYGEVLPKIETMLREELNACYLGDGFTCGEPVGEAGAHNAGKDGHGKPFTKGEVAFSGFGPVLAGNFVLFRVPGETADGNCQHAYADSREY